MKTMDVLIIGGGLAGLACASKLVDGSKVVILLEAQKDLGGRYTSDEPLATQKIFDYLELHGSVIVKRSIGPVDFLALYIEHYGGEIILETPANKLEYDFYDESWLVTTPWGELSARKIVVALPMQRARNILSPVLGREEWFNKSFDNLDQNKHLLFTTDIYHGLYLAGAYTEPTIQSSVLAALASGKRVARSILRL